MGIVERFGPWAVVTGASSGIGREVARALAAQGLHLVVVARRQDSLDALAAELSRAHRVDVQVLALDLGQEGAVPALVQAVAGVDVGLVVHAAGFGLGGAFVDQPLAEHVAMLRLNCEATVALAHAFLPRLQARGRGGLLLVGSVIGFGGVPWAAHYAATKAFVMTLAEGLAVEAAHHGVDVTVVAPGPTRTGFFERASMTASMTATPEQVAATVVRRLRARRIVLADWLAVGIRAAMMFAPRALGVRIMGRIMGGMTRSAG